MFDDGQGSRNFVGGSRANMGELRSRSNESCWKTRLRHGATWIGR